MTQSNFSYQESEFPILFNIGQAAEFNLHQDPVTCLWKLRQFGERVSELLFELHHLDFTISIKAKIDQLPQAILAKSFRGELVSQEVKEYVVEESEGLMAAEEQLSYQAKTKT